MDLFRKKHYATQHHSQLKRCLSSFDLTLLGIGAIIGAGIFILTGIAAATRQGLQYLFLLSSRGLPAHSQHCLMLN